MDRYQLRVDGETVSHYSELCKVLLDDWSTLCATYPQAEKQVEIVRVKEDVVFSQYHFNQFRLLFERPNRKDNAIGSNAVHPPSCSCCACCDDK